MINIRNCRIIIYVLVNLSFRIIEYMRINFKINFIWGSIQSWFFSDLQSFLYRHEKFMLSYTYVVKQNIIRKTDITSCATIYYLLYELLNVLADIAIIGYLKVILKKNKNFMIFFSISFA